MDGIPFEGPGQKYLAIFDGLELEETEQKRIGVYALEEFFGSVMTEVAQEYFELEKSVHKESLVVQWEALLSSLSSREEFRTPQDFDTEIRKLHSIRNKTAHNYHFQVPKGRLLEIRRIAEDWRNWLTSASEDYARQGWFNPQSALESQIERMLGFLQRDIKGLLEENVSKLVLSDIWFSFKQKLDQLDEMQEEPSLGSAHVALISEINELQANVRRVKRTGGSRRQLADDSEEIRLSQGQHNAHDRI